VKRVTVILFLSLLLIQVAGCYIYFVGRLAAIRTEMREQLKYLPDDQLTLLKLTPEEFKKAKVDDHEVKVEGKMYDIARTTITKHHILVYAVHDEAEDNLLSFLDEILKRSSTDKKPVPSQLEELITLIFIPAENQLPAACSMDLIHSTHYSKTFLAFDRIIDSPPPRS